MTARFVLILSPAFRQDLERLPLRSRDQVVKALHLLEISPKGPHPKIKKLKGKGFGQWRLEVWPCRVRYDVKNRDVFLLRVRHRREIYRD
jgi:mRNA-degrading endonuclease RelE of RelBE toxin-antitoxin system